MAQRMNSRGFPRVLPILAFLCVCVIFAPEISPKSETQIPKSKVSPADFWKLGAELGYTQSDGRSWCVTPCTRPYAAGL